MTSKFIWQIGEDWSITKVSKDNNKLFADAKATAVYAVIGNSQMLESDTVEMTCTINGNSYHKVLLHYAETSNHIILDNESVAGWEVVSNGEELQTETSTYDVMTISFDIKRFSTIDGTTLLKNQPTGQTTENVYASDSYTPMIEPSDAERIEDLIAELNLRKQDKVDNSLETTSKSVVGAINELLSKMQDLDLNEITDQNVRITDLSTGIYKWTMSGQCNLYYNGENGNESILTNLLPDNNSEFLIVNKYQMPANSWNWYKISANLGQISILSGVTNTLSGYYNTYDLSEIKTQINNIIVELDNKQDKTDNSLNTTDKTVVGAINELNTGLASKVDKQVTSYNNQGTQQVFNTNTGSGLRWNYAGYENEVEVTNQQINIKSQQQDDDISQINIIRNQIKLSSSDGDIVSPQKTELVITKDDLKVNNQSLVSSIELTINPTTYVLSLQPKDFNGNNIGTAQTVDLPLESIVASATYYATYTYEGVTYNKVIVLTYTTTNVPTIIPVADLVSGLQPEITAQNKLSADLVDDTSTTNKFVNASEKSQITTNATNISTLQGQVATNTQDITKLQYQHLTITLNAQDWSSNTQIKTISTITGNSMIWVSAIPTSIVDYTNAGVIATVQGNGTLTFTCEETPTNNIDITLIINNAPNTGVIQTNGTLIINTTSDTITQVGNRLRIGGTN